MFFYFYCYYFFDLFIKFKIDDLSDDNKELMKYFNKNYLVNVDGKIDLSEVKATALNGEDKIRALYNFEDISYVKLDDTINKKKDDNKLLSEKVVEDTKKIESLDNEIKSLTDQYNVVKKKYDSYVYSKSGYSVPDGSAVLLSNMPTINQYPNYNSGCESVALTILLRANGVSVSPNQVIDSLRKTGLPYSEGGVMYGGNPEVEFVGNPYGNGYGVYQNPIADVARNYKGGIHVETNFPLSKVLELVKNGHPVQVWSSMYLALPYISTSWIYKPTGERIGWKANEHAVVVVGYNNNNIIISDPIGGTIKYQSRSVFESRYNYFGRRALYYL